MATNSTVPYWASLLQKNTSDRLSKVLNASEERTDGIGVQKDGHLTEQHMLSIFSSGWFHLKDTMDLILSKKQHLQGNNNSARIDVRERATKLGSFFNPKRQRINHNFDALLRSVTTENLRQVKAERALQTSDFDKLQTLIQQYMDTRSSGKSIQKKNANRRQNSITWIPTTVHSMNYVDFRRVGFVLPNTIQHLFLPSMFLRFRRDNFGKVDIRTFYEYVSRKEELLCERYSLSHCDTVGDGYLRESDIEYFFEDFLDRVPSLSDLQDDFRTYYVFTAVRKMLFFLDPWSSLKIPIKTILTSAVFREVRALTILQPLENRNQLHLNWFSGSSAMNVYRNYLALDHDQNGMLSKSELANYDGGSLTTCFLDRVWEECRTYLNDNNYESEMDYKVFLDFTLAMENRNTPQGLRWFFKILDINKSGYLDHVVLNYFFRHIKERMVDGDYKSEDILDEIFDMVKPRTKFKIRLHDLIRSGVGGTVVSMLIDVNGFWAYDNRESLVASQSSASDFATLQHIQQVSPDGGGDTDYRDYNDLN